MDKNINLAGMAPEDAKRYVAAHITDLLLLRKRIEERKAELDSWKARADLAASKGIADLAAGAQEQAARIAEALAPLVAEAQALDRDIETMKSQLPGLAARERRIDPDQLLAILQMTTGEFDDPGRAALDKGVKDAQADQDLARLKGELGMEPPEKPEDGPAT